MAKGEKNDILKRFLEVMSLLATGNGRSTTELAEIVKVSERTVQRDMLVLESMLLAEKIDGKWRLIADITLAKKVGSIMERRFIAAYVDVLKDIPQMTDAVNKMQRGLSYSNDIFKVITERPMLLTDENYKTIAALSAYIKNGDKIHFIYGRKGNAEPKIISPYRIIYYDGFWYVAGVTEKSGNLVKFRLDFISDIRQANIDDTNGRSIVFNINKKVAEYIDNATSTWFRAEDIHVKIIAYDDVADTFEKRPIFNNQHIEHKNGQCHVSFTVADFQDFFSSIAKFMPLFDVIEPIEFKEEIKKRIIKYN